MKHLFSRHHWLRFVPILLLIATIMLRFIEPDIIQREELMVFDGYQRLQPRVYQPLPVKIVDIDDESLKKIGQWPWSRWRIAQLITNLTKAHTKVIGFDVVFAEADRSSLVNTLDLWQTVLSKTELKQLSDTLIGKPSFDETLAQVISTTPVVLGFSLVTQINSDQPAVKAAISVVGKRPSLLNSHGTVKNLSLFEQVAAGNGSFNIMPEIDGVIRRLPLVFQLNNTYYPSLALELLRVAQGESSIIVKTQSALIESIKVGQSIIPTDSRGNLLMYYTPPEPRRTIPAWKILDNSFDASELRDAIVLIGTSAAGLKDQRATPLNPFAAGVEIHANALEQVLTGNYLYHPAWLLGLEVSTMVLIGGLLIVVMSRFGAIFSVALLLLSITVIISGSWYAFQQYHWLIDPIYPSFTVVILYFTISLRNYLKSEQEREYIRNAFSHYISPALVEELIKNSASLELGGEMRDMSILFCDIRGFTTISEQLDAGQLTQFINQFLTPMTQIILDERGTIDKYIGDCIMALWSAPLTDVHHAGNACRAALKMLDALQIFNIDQHQIAQREQRPFIEVHIGIGINSGICCVGNMGSNLRFDYSVLGDNVNLASRLEGQSKSYHVDIVVSEYVVASLIAQQQYHQFALLELDLLRVKGKYQPVRIYTVLGGEDVASSADFVELAALHRSLFEHYYAQNWQEALKLTTLCAQLNLFHLVDFYRVYQQRIEFFIVEPPVKEWDGVYIATTK